MDLLEKMIYDKLSGELSLFANLDSDTECQADKEEAL